MSKKKKCIGWILVATGSVFMYILQWYALNNDMPIDRGYISILGALNILSLIAPGVFLLGLYAKEKHAVLGKWIIGIVCFVGAIAMLFVVKEIFATVNIS